jgi:hypothetical protein
MWPTLRLRASILNKQLSWPESRGISDRKFRQEALQEDRIHRLHKKQPDSNNISRISLVKIGKRLSG